MKKHYETHVEDTDKLISVAGPVLDYKSWYEQYRKLMEEQAQRKYGLYTPTSEGDGGVFPSISGITARYSALGLTNERMAENPVWKDLTGNGHDLQMKNFAWKGMSGVGGYEMNFNLWRNNVPGIPDISMSTTTTSVSVSVGNSTYNNNLIYIHISNWDINKNHWLKVTSTYEDGDLAFVFYNDNNTKRIGLPANGYVNILAYPEFKGSYMYISTISNKQGSFTIEQLPLYPGFILGDGVDDFAVTEKELNFEDTYTVYTAFIPFQDDPARNMILCGKNETKDFSINYSGTHINFQPSTGVNLVPRINQFMLLVCKRNKDITTIINLFTGESRSLSSKEFIANPGLYYLWRNVYATFLARAAIAGQTICNGYFSTDEDDEKVLNYYKQEYPWLFPGQAWTVVGKTNEDEDRATIANITGNGNDLVLSNVAFSENSGYGSYPFGMNVWYPDYIADQPYGTVHYPDSNSYATIVKDNTTNFRIKFRLRGLPEGGSFLIQVSDMNDLNGVLKAYTYTENGIHEFVYNDPNKPARIIVYNGNTPSDVSEFYLDIIPEYEGYLITDGVDDKIQSSAFTVGKDWTTVGEWEFLKEDAIKTAGIAKFGSFRLYNYSLTGRMNVYINSDLGTNVIGDSIKAATSKGSVYLDFNEVTEVTPGDAVDSGQNLFIGYNGNNFTKLAFKNLAIYPRILSKDDCIKAYNYLQTLKAK